MNPLTTAQPPPSNGKPIMDRLVDDEPMTSGYKPTLPAWTFWNPDGTPILFVMRDIELMMTHPVVHQGLEYYKAGIGGAEFDVKCQNSEAGQFIMDQVQRFWDKGMPSTQLGYEYGWLGGENLYSDDEGHIKWDKLLDFAPRDTFLLTQKSKAVGVRVKNIQQQGQVDLWMGDDNVPSKGFWYCHRPRYGQYYGRSQLMAAWRPWKRLAWKDAAESNIDMAVYRFGVAGPLVRYPPEDIQGGGPPGVPGTTLDSQGRPRKYSREVARQMGEQLRFGAAIAFSSEKYPTEQGGHYKWDVEWPDHVLNVDPLLNYAKWLQDQIYFGIGVPPELIQAAETGSGYSGRQIPLEAFLWQQQRIADAMLDAFVQQVLRPLVILNFGDVRFEVKVKPLLQTKNQQRAGQSGESAPHQKGVLAGTEGGKMPGQIPATGVAQPKPQAPVIPLSMLSAMASDEEKQIVWKILKRAA